jgi:hypothetical protein
MSELLRVLRRSAAGSRRALPSVAGLIGYIERGHRSLLSPEEDCTAFARLCPVFMDQS